LLIICVDPLQWHPTASYCSLISEYTSLTHARGMVSNYPEPNPISLLMHLWEGPEGQFWRPQDPYSTLLILYQAFYTNPNLNILLVPSSLYPSQVPYSNPKHPTRATQSYSWPKHPVLDPATFLAPKILSLVLSPYSGPQHPMSSPSPNQSLIPSPSCYRL